MDHIFSFDDSDSFARKRTETFSSVESRDDSWLHETLGASTSNGHVSAVGSKNAFRKSFKEGSANESAITEEDETEVLPANALAENAGDIVGNDDSLDQHHNKLVDSIVSFPAERSDICNKRMEADHFEPIRVLGQGGFGTVLLVRHKATGELYAQKQMKKASISKKAKHVEYTMAERSILEEVKNPFIVKLFYAFQDYSSLYLILEYAAGGELFYHLATEKMFSEDVAAFYIAEAYLGLSALHSKGVVYRDLKAENLLLDSSGHLLLTDFGLSKIALEDEKCKSFAGTFEYMAPEMILELPYTYTVDYWALGILMYDLLTGSPPFTSDSPSKVSDKIISAKLHLPFFLSTDAKTLLKRLLEKDPLKRLGAREHDSQKLRKHKFFQNLDWQKVEDRSCDPPIRPVITDASLAENFSSSFTQMPIPPSFLPHHQHHHHNSTSLGNTPHTILQKPESSHDSPFMGFTYTASFDDRRFK